MGGEGFVQLFPDLGQQLEGVFMAGVSGGESSSPVTGAGHNQQQWGRVLSACASLSEAAQSGVFAAPAVPPRLILVPAISSAPAPLLGKLGRAQWQQAGAARRGGIAGTSRGHQPHTPGPKPALRSRERQFQDPKVGAAAGSCTQELLGDHVPRGARHSEALPHPAPPRWLHRWERTDATAAQNRGRVCPAAPWEPFLGQSHKSGLKIKGVSGLTSSTRLKQAGQEKHTRCDPTRGCRTLPGPPRPCWGHPWHSTTGQSCFLSSWCKRGWRQVWGNADAGGAVGGNRREGNCKEAALAGEVARLSHVLASAPGTACAAQREEPPPSRLSGERSWRPGALGTRCEQSQATPWPHAGTNLPRCCSQSRTPPKPPLGHGDSRAAGPKSTDWEGWAPWAGIQEATAPQHQEPVKRPLTPVQPPSSIASMPQGGVSAQAAPAHARGDAGVLRPSPAKARPTQTTRHKRFNQQPATGGATHTSVRDFR